MHLPGETTGVGAQGNGVKDLSVPLDSVPHVYLGQGERDVDYSATVGDEIRHQSCIWTVEEKHELDSDPMAMPAVCHGLQGGSQTFWRHHF